MDEIISNNQLATFLRRQIFLNPEYNKQPKLDNLKYCGSRVINPSTPAAVKLIANKKESKFTGITCCHSTWSCPHCSAKVLAQKAGDIAVAIDALATWFKLRPMMITFTLPHTENMSCQETYTILQKAWRQFANGGRNKKQYVLKRTVGESQNISYGKADGTKNKYDKRAVGTAGDIKTYEKKIISTKFKDDLDIKHSVRAYEFTWGENSWHPHIHALFWTHEKNWDKIAEYEPALFEYWWKCTKHQALKYWNQKYPDQKEENLKRVNNLFTEWRKEPNAAHRSLYISKDVNGAVLKMSSSRYICGWGGDNELTNQAHAKTPREGHYTPFQILELAYKNANERQKWLDLFIEYAKATHGHRRIEFSTHSGIRQIINKWKKTNTYITAYKKKVAESGGKFKIIYWFTSKQWKQICWIDTESDSEIKQQILDYAMLPDGKKLITELLLALEIPLWTPANEASELSIKHYLEQYEANLYGNREPA